MTIPTPKEIKAYLDQYVIGQDRAKKILLSVESDFRTKRAAYKSINAVKTKEEYASVVEALPFCKDIKLRFTETL